MVVLRSEGKKTRIGYNQIPGERFGEKYATFGGDISRILGLFEIDWVLAGFIEQSFMVDTTPSSPAHCKTKEVGCTRKSKRVFRLFGIRASTRCVDETREFFVRSRNNERTGDYLSLCVYIYIYVVSK